MEDVPNDDAGAPADDKPAENQVVDAGTASKEHRPPAAAEMVVASDRCQNCRLDLMEDANFCRQCGTQRHQEPVPEPIFPLELPPAETLEMSLSVQFQGEHSEHPFHAEEHLCDPTEATPLLAKTQAAQNMGSGAEGSTENLKIRYQKSRTNTLSLMDMRRATASSVEKKSLLKNKNIIKAPLVDSHGSASGGSWRPESAAWRSLVPSAGDARRNFAISSAASGRFAQGARGLAVHHEHRHSSPSPDSAHEKLDNDKKGSSLKHIRPAMTPLVVRRPRDRPVAWTERKQHLEQIRAAQMESQFAVEGHVPSLSESSPGFLSQAHLRSDAYWKDLLGGEEEVGGFFWWVQEKWCNYVIAACVVCEALLLGLHFPDDMPPLWCRALMDVILGVSVIELLLQFRNYSVGVHFKHAEDKSLLTIDAVAVLLCTLEFWAWPRFGGSGLHLSRMAWLMRFLRVLSLIQSLRELTLGVIEALQGLFWVLVFLAIFLYALGVVLTRVIGHDGTFQTITGRQDEDPDSAHEHGLQEVRDMFGNVPSSMFYLFQTTSQWSLVPLLPLLNASVSARIGFTLFYIYSGWVLVAVMTGTVSFTMIAFKSRNSSTDDEEDKRHFVSEFLLDVFETLDQDGSGDLSYDEFRSLLANKEIVLLLATHTEIKLQDLEDMWQWLDSDQSGSVTVAEFFEGFELLNEPFRQKTVLRLQERLSRDIQSVHKRMESHVLLNFDRCRALIGEPLKKIHAVLEQVQVLLLTVGAINNEVGLQPMLPEQGLISAHAQEDERPYLHSLESIESALGAGIDEALDRITKFKAASPVRLRKKQ